MAIVLHLCPAADWSTAGATAELRPASLDGEGFVHCSTSAQLPGVVERFYAEVADQLLVLAVDTAHPSVAGTELRWEPPAHPHADPDERFPHLYGPLPVAAVVEVVPWPEWRAAHPG